MILSHFCTARRPPALTKTRLPLGKCGDREGAECRVNDPVASQPLLGARLTSAGDAEHA